ncbi:protein rarD [Piscinibacter sakaiensis]|uniref:Protein rarD n=1 Tax=Piscinibacter sakaiensis TaxID=1547922 RepID=A0A0K8NZ59_PISS1|nr:protein rarD [Piscinibacter sakaiensis]
MWYASAAYVCWGLFPLYFRALADVPASEVLVHRIVWSLVFVALLLGLRRQWRWLGEALRQPRLVGSVAVSALLLSTNWLTYIWAITHGQIVEASLGYFITPLVNVGLGVAVLRERPRAMQWAALALASAGVAGLTLATGRLPWIALVLAASFGLYGLMRKTAPLGALEGLALETLLLAPFALGTAALWMLQGTSHFPAPTLATNLWLIGVGPVTAVPLLLFAAGARRVTMTTLGLLQYIGPSLQLLVGVGLLGERFGAERLPGFVLIWLALATYSVDGLRQARRPVAPA